MNQELLNVILIISGCVFVIVIGLSKINPIKVVDFNGNRYRVDTMQRKVWKAVYLDSGRMIWNPDRISPEERSGVLACVSYISEVKRAEVET